MNKPLLSAPVEQIKTLAQIYEETFNALYNVASPDLKQKINNLKINSSTQDRDCDDFIKKVIQQAEAQEQQNKKI